jgi:hypothetical protein
MEKVEHKYGAWDIQGIPYKDERLDDILVKQNTGNARITETKWKLKGSKETRNYFQFYSSIDQKVLAQVGVALMAHKKFGKAIDNWNERIIQMRIKISVGYLIVICICAPIEGQEEENYAFYENHQKIINNVIESDILLLMGDFNARVGNIPVNSNVGRIGETT